MPIYAWFFTILLIVLCLCAVVGAISLAVLLFKAAFFNKKR